MLNPQPVHAMMVDFSSMEEQDEQVSLEPDIPVNMENMILNDLEQSKERISGIFDGINATPTILFVQSPQALEKYAQQNRTGQTYYTYWGHYIVIGPDGFDVDEIAHSEVARWFGIVGKLGLAELIEGLNKGGVFIELYKAIESRG